MESDAAEVDAGMNGTAAGGPMITRGTRLVRPTSDDAVPPAGDQGAGAGRRVASRIVALLRAESSLALAAFSIVPLRIIADTPHIGEVGHFGFLTQVLLVYILLVVVFAALGVVRHAERLAEKYGEPYGTLILTVSAVTVEVVMLTTMVLHGENDPMLARDTIFATVMVLVNGLVGLSLLMGGLRYGEQRYNLKSSKAFLTMLFALTGLALILPDTLSPAQEPELEVFLVFASLLLYGFFLHVQTRKHAHFFTFDGSLATHHPFESDRAASEPTRSVAPTTPPCSCSRSSDLAARRVPLDRSRRHGGGPALPSSASGADRRDHHRLAGVFDGDPGGVAR
jgi:hypothetical protein